MTRLEKLYQLKKNLDQLTQKAKEILDENPGTHYKGVYNDIIMVYSGLEKISTAWLQDAIITEKN